MTNAEATADALPEPFEAVAPVVPPCTVCDRCWSSGEKYVCRGEETVYDPVQGVERPVELPCAVARETPFCGFTQDWLKAWYRRRSLLDRLLVASSILVPLALVVAGGVLMGFVVADLPVDQQTPDWIMAVLVGMVDAIVMLACLGWLAFEAAKAAKWRFHTPRLYQARRSLKRAQEFESKKGR